MIDNSGVTAADVIAVSLTSDERYMLQRGLSEWGGPAWATDQLAQVIGFRDEDDLLRHEGRRLREDLGRSQPLTASDWRRVLLSTEIVFASDVVGSGSDWSITTGLSDEETIKMLRAVQRKIGRALRSD